MSASPSNKTSPWPGIIIGLVLMLAGMYVSVNMKEALKPIYEPLEGAGLPLDLGKTVAAIGVFLILFPVIRSFFIDPLDEAIRSRNTELEKTFNEVETLRSDMTQMKSNYERQLAETEASAREQIQAQVKEAQELRKTLMAEATARADEMLQKATEEIAAEKSKALTEIRVQVASLTLMASERILSENMDNDRNRRLVEEFLDKVEVKN